MMRPLFPAKGGGLPPAGAIPMVGGGMTATAMSPMPAAAAQAPATRMNPAQAFKASQQAYIQQMMNPSAAQGGWYLNGVKQSVPYSEENLRAAFAPVPHVEYEGGFSGNTAGQHGGLQTRGMKGGVALGGTNGGPASNGASSGGGFGQALGGLLSNITSYMAGGVNAPNPGSLLNRAVAALSPAQGQPTAADRPRANPMR